MNIRIFFQNKKIIYVIIAIVIVLTIGIIYIFDLLPESLKKTIFFGPKGTVIEENLVIPNTEKIAVVEGRFVSPGTYQTPLVPKSDAEEIIAPKAVYTARNGYDVSINEARKWSADAKLIFIKSLGAITLEGKSSQWQIVFGSKTKKKGYEIIIQADKVVSQKEIPSDSFGYDLPKNWYDSGEAIKSLQTMPQFSDAAVSSISFYYNTDGKNWGYGLATSRGTTSMPVR